MSTSTFQKRFEYSSSKSPIKFVYFLLLVLFSEMVMKSLIKEMLVYFSYLAIIMVINHGSADSNAFLQKSAIEKAIVYGGMNCEILPVGELKQSRQHWTLTMLCNGHGS